MGYRFLEKSPSLEVSQEMIESMGVECRGGCNQHGQRDTTVEKRIIIKPVQRMRVGLRRKLFSGSQREGN